METANESQSLENYFSKFRSEIIGINLTLNTPYGKNMPLIYTDWTASGRCYKPLEEKLQNQIMPWVANTHTETNSTGRFMTLAYHKAQQIIKQHVNANDGDALISQYSGMTGLVNKFQRILGLKIHETFKDKIITSEDERPVVFVSHMEHHSNQTSWLETIAEVVVVPPDSDGLFSLDNFKNLLAQYPGRKLKIAAITACSNVTGIFTPYHEIAEIIHDANGYCFVDFACCAPYVDINMHPKNPKAALDAIFFSPHKFLGGPGSAGVMIFNKKMYNNEVPDSAGGGTVEWTNPWGGRRYYEDIETREDGGTPAFMQTIRTAMCIGLKNEMGVSNIMEREKQLLQIIFDGLEGISNLHILASQHKHRLGVVSFYIDNLHYNIAVRILNDRFGLQTRGGCSCAGTYGHYLLNVDQNYSQHITEKIDAGNYEEKPGWVRASIHPTTTDAEARFLVNALRLLAQNATEWAKDYMLDPKTNAVVYVGNEAEINLEEMVNNALSMN